MVRRRKKIRNRLDVVKADEKHDVVWVKTKDGEVHEIALMPRGHYRTRGRIKPRKKKKRKKKAKPITKEEWHKIYEKCGGTPREKPECWRRELKKRK